MFAIEGKRLSLNMAQQSLVSIIPADNSKFLNPVLLAVA